MLGRHLLYQSGPPIPVGEKWTFTSNGTWVAPANGNYKITLVGAGGKGGSGCERRRYYQMSSDGGSSCYVCSGCGSASGGGGGAGQTIVQTHTLKKDAELTITIGQPNSNPSKISGVISITANGGDSGGSAYRSTYRNCPTKAYAGGVAVNYGTGGGSGYVSDRDNHSPGGGAGKVSDYGNGYGQGGQGGRGEWNNGSFLPGNNGTAGICVIEYIGM